MEKNNSDADKQGTDESGLGLYKIPPGIVSCRSEPIVKTLSDLLLNFDGLFSEDQQTRLFKIVTVPWEKYDLGWKVAAFQVFLKKGSFATLVDEPEDDKIYIFYEALVSVREASVRLMMGGLKGLILGIRRKAILYEELSKDNTDWINHDPYDCKEWYHYLGTHKELLWELESRSVQAKAVFGR